MYTEALRLAPLQEQLRLNDDAHWSELMQRGQAGDSSAYSCLLSELGDAIAGYLYRRFGRVEFADDCVQECLLAIHEARHTFVHGRLFRPWMFAIVRHRTIDALRRQRAYAGLFDGGLDEATIDAASQAQGVDNDIDGMSAGSVLAALSDGHRQALTLTKLMGFSTAEAAGQLGISESAMKVRVHRATQAAVKMLEAERT